MSWISFSKLDFMFSMSFTKKSIPDLSSVFFLTGTGGGAFADGLWFGLGNGVR